ncbi:MAG: hypothetical protein LBQ54_10810, partial [Planctomycetaceae bacterium]|nr:hypothetical protein [Planctomycetaceae bacterium]
SSFSGSPNVPPENHQTSKASRDPSTNTRPPSEISRQTPARKAAKTRCFEIAMLMQKAIVPEQKRIVGLRSNVLRWRRGSRPCHAAGTKGK